MATIQRKAKSIKAFLKRFDEEFGRIAQMIF